MAQWGSTLIDSWQAGLEFFATRLNFQLKLTVLFYELDFFLSWHPKGLFIHHTWIQKCKKGFDMHKSYPFQACQDDINTFCSKLLLTGLQSCPIKCLSKIGYNFSQRSRWYIEMRHMIFWSIFRSTRSSFRKCWSKHVIAKRCLSSSSSSLALFAPWTIINCSNIMLILFVNWSAWARGLEITFCFLLFSMCAHASHWISAMRGFV